MIGTENIGEATGQPGERFRPPERSAGRRSTNPSSRSAHRRAGRQWEIVDSFADHGPDDRVVILDAAAGEIEFAPLVRLEDGSLRAYGAMPAGPGRRSASANHAIGGGGDGNVRARTLTSLRSSIPFVRGVTNRHPASDGVDAESVDEAQVRGPLMLRTRSRAVTAEDFELLTREAAPEIARVRSIPATSAADAGTVTVCIVPAAARDGDIVHLEDLLPTRTDPRGDRREARRLPGDRYDRARRAADLPGRHGRGPPSGRRRAPMPTVSAARPSPHCIATSIRWSAVPTATGGRGAGRCKSGDAFAVLQRIAGVDVVEDVRLFGANPVTGERGDATERIELAPNSLVFSYEHQVRVVTP